MNLERTNRMALNRMLIECDRARRIHGEYSKEYNQARQEYRDFKHCVTSQA